MTDQDKIIALAKLDGFEDPHNSLGWLPAQEIGDLPALVELPHYLTRYDAIIPLIQKQDMRTQSRIWQQLNCSYEWNATPRELCDALLKAKGLL